MAFCLPQGSPPHLHPKPVLNASLSFGIYLAICLQLFWTPSTVCTTVLTEQLESSSSQWGIVIADACRMDDTVHRDRLCCMISCNVCIMLLVSLHVTIDIPIMRTCLQPVCLYRLARDRAPKKMKKPSEAGLTCASRVAGRACSHFWLDQAHWHPPSTPPHCF